jgi:hypothetical protein
MGARRLYHIKEVYPDDAVLEVVIWKLPKATKDRPHGLKYRFYYGSADGSIEIRYDNETGKGDHCHYGNREEPYVFVDIDTLVADFMADVKKARGER